MQQRQLGPFSVSAIGLGCMNICHAYGTPISESEAERLLRRVISIAPDFDDARLDLARVLKQRDKVEVS